MNNAPAPPHSRSPSNAQAWSSGRVLTAEQRERKRQVNRKSSRTARKDFQSRLVELEERVISLELQRAQCPHCSCHHADSVVPKQEPDEPPPSFPAFEHPDLHYNPHTTSPRWSAAPQSHQYQDRPNQGFFQVSTSPAGGAPAFEPEYARRSSSSGQSSGHRDPVNQMHSPVSSVSNHSGARHLAPSHAGSTMQHSQSSRPLQLPRDAVQTGNEQVPIPAPPTVRTGDPEWVFETTEQFTHARNPTSIMAKDISAQALDSQAILLALQTANNNMPLLRDMDPHGRDITRLCNALVQYVRTLTPQDICLNETHNQDVLIRGVLLGWDQALARYQTHCPLWLVTRQVDAWLFQRCQVNERVCTLRIIHQMYLYEILNGVAPDDLVPAWYKPRPSQQCFQHEPVIDHLCWPGLRERLTISENNLLTNRFWYSFAHNFRFIWPHSPGQAFQLQPGTSYYTLSADFQTCMQDIGRYRMNSQFFNQFPQLYEDIGPADLLLMSEMPMSSENPNRMLEQNVTEEERLKSHDIVSF